MIKNFLDICMFSKTHGCSLFTVVALFLTSNAVYSPVYAELPNITKSSSNATIDNPFEEAYWGLELAANTPLAKTKQKLKAGSPQIAVSYSYLLSTGWLLTVKGGFREFKRSQVIPGQNTNVSILSAGYESLHGWRIYHPLYFFAGTRLEYLLPTTGIELPLHRDDDYRAEFGAGAIAMLALKPKGNLLYVSKIARWRGIATTALEGLEMTVGISTDF